jgi:hypothetical protein
LIDFGRVEQQISFQCGYPSLECREQLSAWSETANIHEKLERVLVQIKEKCCAASGDAWGTIAAD